MEKVHAAVLLALREIFVIQVPIFVYQQEQNINYILQQNVPKVHLENPVVASVIVVTNCATISQENVVKHSARKTFSLPTV